MVDVGCGTGGNFAPLVGDYELVGIDTSPDAIRLAQTRFPQVEFLVGSAPRDLGARAGRADLVLLTDVLEHVADDFLLLSQLLAAAKPGAWLLITVPAQPQLWSEHDESHLHYRRYDVPRLERTWQDLPVTPALVTYFNARLYPLIRAVRTWTRWRGRASGEAQTDLWLPPAVVNRTLTRLFAGESRRLTRWLEHPPARTYRRGLSLLAVLRREAGPIEPRSRPADVAPDRFDPYAHTQGGDALSLE